NRRYETTRNLNRLLADAHTQAALAVWNSVRAPIVTDQFAQQKELLTEAFARSGLPAPVQAHHAEQASVAVAAASILATSAFRSALVELGKRAGLEGPLPAGSSDVEALTQVARSILQREGTEGLSRYARLHFRPLQKLLAGSAVPACDPAMRA